MASLASLSGFGTGGDIIQPLGQDMRRNFRGTPNGQPMATPQSPNSFDDAFSAWAASQPQAGSPGSFGTPLATGQVGASMPTRAAGGIGQPGDQGIDQGFTGNDMYGAMPQGPSMPTRTPGGFTFDRNADYTTNLKNYRGANPTTDLGANDPQMVQLAAQQRQWMQQNPGMGDNPTGPGLQPFGVPPPGAPAGGNGSSPATGPLGFREAAGNYTGGMNLSDYLDPSFAWRADQGRQAVANTYGAGGNFLSGAALKGITDYNQNAASQEYNAANQRYMQDKGFNYGVDMNDQTIPFNENLSLAQLGLQGAGLGTQSNTNLANILSSNLMGGANAGAAGSVAQGNLLTQAIQNALQNYNSGQLMNRIPGLLPQGG